MLSRTDAVALVQDRLKPAFDLEQRRLANIDLWYRWQHEPVRIPNKATQELRALIELARTPWASLIVTAIAQNMRVDGYRTPEAREDSRPWRAWRANGLNGRQRAVHRGMLAYGVAYGTATPGVDPLTGEAMAVLRGVSARKMLAFYVNPAEDVWPEYALRYDGDNEWRLYDASHVYRLAVKSDPGSGVSKLEYVGEDEHGVGVCPIVRFSNMLDLDGRTDGEVEPLVDVMKRLDKTAYDRLMIQHFNSWKVRTVAGMAQPDTDEEAAAAKLKLRHDDILIAEDPDTKFGALPETPLDGMIRAYETDVKTLAAASQTPVHALTGDLINLSAEALAAANAQLDAKVAERRQSAGESWAQLLRLGAFIDGDTESANDVMAEVTWADTSVRSMAQAADALGKMATMLGVPPRALWPLIPGVSKTDVADWEKIAAEGDPLAELTAVLDAQASAPAFDAEELKAKSDAMGTLIRSGVEPVDAARLVGFTGIGFTGAVPVTLRQPESAASALEPA